MSNTFKALGTPVGNLNLSNGGTDVFFDVLTLAGCALAESAWESNLVLLFADGHRIGRGTDGFDLNELPWTANWPAEKAFLLRVVDLAMTRHGWDLLAYQPPFAPDYLRRYRAMVDGWRAPIPVRTPATRPDWTVPPPPEYLERCPKHALYNGMLGCRLCDLTIQPLPE
ncbi:hypothetical protein BKA00_002319 [Actinomadura coerulea]|uniref:Uncharacterized protein n=1 Tax=Actinomadura coerulea TaxID=46159 RepID=A0A7X0FX83_9ACTN|nr:hypothetical protein [Actinomadura coerulea]MBB6395405.1 hypothetical protein [Actinomadura coerulea]GGQ43425.1 hypothetical protein GCM10010187_72430 [Actinomadura coerulea]